LQIFFEDKLRGPDGSFSSTPANSILARRPKLKGESSATLKSSLKGFNCLGHALMFCGAVLLLAGAMLREA
jgi:hypothetical protein